MRDALADGDDPAEKDRAEKDRLNRERNVGILKGKCESLMNSVCIGLIHPMEEVEGLQEEMDAIEQELLDARSVPADWENWRVFLDLVSRLWDRVKETCTS